MSKQVKARDFIRSTISCGEGITKGNIYYVIEVRDEEPLNVVFVDDKGIRRAFWKTSEFEVIGGIAEVTIVPKNPLKDIQGNDVFVGDTIAYAFSGSQSRHLALFEVQSINGPAALCRSKTDGAVINLGVFEERAIKIKE